MLLYCTLIGAITMLKLNYLVSILLILILLFMNGCCFGNNKFLVSPNRIKGSEINTELLQLKKLRDVKIIGHGGASFSHYPMNVNNQQEPIGNYDRNISNIIDLMSLVFESDSSQKIDAIELDIQVPPVSHILCADAKSADSECSFIMHDTPKWEAFNTNKNTKIFTYMKKNTLRKILNNFVEKKYYEKGKQLYIEIKSPSNECSLPNVNTKKCLVGADEFLKEVKLLTKKYPYIKNIKSWLRVVSFSASSLTHIHKYIGIDMDYSFIAGYHESSFIKKILKRKLSQCKGAVPVFTNEMQDFASYNGWLDSVWFSYKGIEKPNKMFKKMYEKRQIFCKTRKCKKLMFSVASYDIGKKKFKKNIQEFSFPLRSIMVDIDYLKK